MRNITEYINDTLGYKCQILFDSSDIMQRKIKIQNNREKEINNWKSLLKYSLVFAIPTLILTMILSLFNEFVLIFNKEILIGLTVRDLTLFLLSTPIQFGPPGILFYKGAYKSLRGGSANMDVLVALATSISYFFSIITVIINLIMRQDIASNSHNTTFETSAVLITVILIGKYMETIAKAKTSKALDKLMDLQPSTAKLVTNYNDNNINNNDSIKIRIIDSRLLQKDDIIEVTRGSKCPCDGTVLKGSSKMDESLITGESKPVKKCFGDMVIGATVNLNNTLYVKVTKVGNDTVLSKIITLVENAQASRAPIQKQADSIASKFVPIVIFLSLMVTIGWYIAFTLDIVDVTELNIVKNFKAHSYVYYSLSFGISVLVISCPCALGLATPTAVMVATGKAAELGILFKGGEPLELAGKTNILIWDKTGTLTEGKMSVNKCIKVNDNRLKDVLKCNGNINHRFWNYIYGSESQSEHLIATAICKFINKEHNKDENENVKDTDSMKKLRRKELGNEFKCEYMTPNEFKPQSGLGINAVFDNANVFVGNYKYMKSKNIDMTLFSEYLKDNEEIIKNMNEMDNEYEISELIDVDDDIKFDSENDGIILNLLNNLSKDGDTVIFISINNVLVCMLCVSDKIKSNAVEVINYLQNIRHIPCYMITGDNIITATKIGSELNIPKERIYASIEPSGKQSIVKQLQSQKNIIIQRKKKKNKKYYQSTNMDDDNKLSLYNHSKTDVLNNNDGYELTHKNNIITFIGDGINDSPSLAQANIGIAIGCGTDVAIASASVVLMNSNLKDVLNAIDISQKTSYRIKCNFVWAFVYNIIMIPFAAGILYPFLHYRLPPYFAGLLMSFSSVSVVLSSLTLRFYQPPRNKQTNLYN